MMYHGKISDTWSRRQRFRCRLKSQDGVEHPHHVPRRLYILLRTNYDQWRGRKARMQMTENDRARMMGRCEMRPQDAGLGDSYKEQPLASDCPRRERPLDCSLRSLFVALQLLCCRGCADLLSFLFRKKEKDEGAL